MWGHHPLKAGEARGPALRQDGRGDGQGLSGNPGLWPGELRLGWG